MKLYICFTEGGPEGHPCKKAADALHAAGYKPDVEKVKGIGFLPKAFRNTAGRRKVSELTGNHHVPTLVLDNGSVVDGSQNIMDWAAKNPNSAS